MLHKNTGAGTVPENLVLRDSAFRNGSDVSVENTIEKLGRAGAAKRLIPLDQFRLIWSFRCTSPLQRGIARSVSVAIPAGNQSKN